MNELIKKLVEAYGPSGFEDGMRDLIRPEIEAYADEISVDALGNLIAVKKGSGGGLKVMIAAHMDEIGVMVTHITQDGFLRFTNIGGVLPHNLMGSRVQFANGVIGVISSDRLEDRSKIHPLTKFFIDVGASSPDDCPVGVGDAAGFVRPFLAQGKRLTAKAMDDRIGCVVAIETLKRLKTTPHDVYFAFTVQEEVGLRGATVAAHALAPDIALAVDSTPARDLPASDGRENVAYNTQLDRGPAIYIADADTLPSQRMIRHFAETGDALDIPYQFRQPGGGGTDAGAMHQQLEGIPALSISVPGRYAHTPVGLARVSDWQNTLRLIHAGVSRMTPALLKR